MHSTEDSTIPENVPTQSTGRKRKQVANETDPRHVYPSFQPDAANKRVKATPGDSPTSSKPATQKDGKTSDTSNGKAQNEEKRLRRFRAKPPQAYLTIKERALTQRLIVQSRERCGTEDVPEEKVLIAGTTGNLYTVHIGLVPSCNCPHAKKGNQCKHIIYVMLRVLKAPEAVGYQLALTSSELRDLFRNAPAIPTADSEADSSDGNRKPIEGECPICYCEFEPDKEEISYCKAACGNNVHKACMEAWAKARSGKVTCPYCRSVWGASEVSGKKADLALASVNEEGYMNVASQLGLSGERDYSTYHRYWVQSQQGYGGLYGSSRRG